MNDLICKAEIERDTDIWIPRGKGRRRRNREIRMDTNTLSILCIQYITSENILCSV